MTVSDAVVIPAPLGACWVPNAPAGAEGPRIERIFALSVWPAHTPAGHHHHALSSDGRWLPIGRGQDQGRLRA